MSDRGPGEIFFAFVRHWSRRADPSIADQGQLVLVTEAVHALALRGVEATVNAVGQEIGIDQSGASRLIRSATEAGYLATGVSELDARRRLASVTPAGRQMLGQAHAWQEAVFARLTADWSDRRRHDFQQAMLDLMQRSWESGDRNGIADGDA